jgi:ABC-type cobalamin/Fe3+-siderophores transport system ATPase subunit
MNPCIDIQNTTIAYREGLALNSISLTINEGEFVAIAGPNGAGKTTLLTAINGLARVSAGTQSIFGMQVNKRTQNVIRRDIGYVSQIANIDPRMPMRVKDVVMLGRLARTGLFKKLSSQDNDILEQVFELTDIRHLINKPIGHLSGGEQRKVAIARALAQEPRIMLLDEPISSLDINAQAAILELIDKVHQKKRLTTVLVMHQLDLLPKNCFRIILLKNARIIFDGALKEALREDILSELYDCRVEIIQNDCAVVIRARPRGSRC